MQDDLFEQWGDRWAQGVAKARQRYVDGLRTRKEMYRVMLALSAELQRKRYKAAEKRLAEFNALYPKED